MPFKRSCVLLALWGTSALAGQPPRAQCRNDTVPATTECGARYDVNYGSYDPDNDLVSCDQSPTPSDLLPIGTTEVTLTCHDRQDLYDVCIGTVTVTDATVPTITLQGSTSQNAECGPTYTDPGATAQDPCENDLSSKIYKAGSVDPKTLGTYSLTYNVSNSKGHSATPVTRTVRIQDTTPPTITCPPPAEADPESDGFATVPLRHATAADTCSSVTLTEPTQTRFPLGTTTLTYKARDAFGNESSCTTTVHVGSDLITNDRALLGAGCSSAGTDEAFSALALVWLSLLWHRRRNARRAWSPRPWLLLGLLLLALPASAQSSTIPSFDLERLRLNPSAAGSLLLGTGELLPDRGYRLSLTGHYEYKPLSLYEDGVLQGVVVRHRATAVLAGAVGLLDRLELGAQVPLVLMQQGDDLTARGLNPPSGGVALGTPLITLRLKLLAEYDEAPMDLALGVDAGPGVGSASALARELHATPSVMMGHSFGVLRASLDAGLLIRPDTILSQDANIQDELGSALQLGAGLGTTGAGLRGEVAAFASVPLRREGSSLEVLGGVRLPVGELLEAYGLAGLGGGDAPGTPRFRLLLGVAVGKASRPAKSRPEALTGLDDDKDHDGVLNRDDACPDEPGPANHRGCPLLDSDGDGLVDERDRCPHEAGIIEMRGCPPKDTDGDTVWDHEDNCRNIPGPVENQGCPIQQRQLVIIQRGRIEIKDTIYFDFDKATIKRQSFPLLDQVAHVLIEHPEIVRVSIEGHTDDRGTDAYNHELSRQRANAVRDYLANQGVERERMTIRSFGEDRPLQPNTTERGRAINRRVEFITHYELDEP